MYKPAAAILSALVLVAPLDVNGETAAAAPKPCDAPSYRQFDFWIGQWEVLDGAGKRAGHNAITLEEDGCVLVEHWHSASGGTGMSMNHYDPLTASWKQHWVGLGIVLEMSGGLRDGKMIMQGPLHYILEKRNTLLRGEWTVLPDGRVRQHFLESSDEGKTWIDWFDGYYSKVKR